MRNSSKRRRGSSTGEHGPLERVSGLEPDDLYAERLLTRMLEIYSPSGGEGELAKFLAEELAGLGFEVKLDEVGNLLADCGEGEPSILLCGHMDTVQGEIAVRRRGRVLFGRGAVDAKGPLASLIVSTARHLARGGRGRARLLAVVDEEGRSTGIKWFLGRNRESYDYAIFGEPSGSRCITIGYKGRLQLRVDVFTKAGHASAPHKFKSAVMEAYKLITAMEGSLWTRREDPVESTTFCVTKIEGGGVENTVPSKCLFVADVRLPYGRRTADVEREVGKVIEEFVRNSPGVSVKWGVEDRNEPYLADANSKLVRALSEAIEEVAGVRAQLVKKTGTADVNDFALALRAETAVYGPGSSKLDHSPNENISIPEYLESIKVLERALWKLTSSGAGT